MKRPSLKSLLILLACALCCARPAAAQEQPCRLERAVAPDYGGVMLGMTAEELARMFPGSDELQKARDAAPAAAPQPFVASLGMLELGIRREHFGDAAELLLTFLGGRLNRMDVRYRRPAPWKDVTEFSAHASKRLALPADSWGAAVSDAEKQSRALECRGFSVVVSIERAGPSTLSVVDTAAASSSSSPQQTPAAKEATPAATPARGRRGRRPPKTRPRSAPAAGGEEKPF